MYTLFFDNDNMISSYNYVDGLYKKKKQCNFIIFAGPKQNMWSLHAGKVSAI